MVSWTRPVVVMMSILMPARSWLPWLCSLTDEGAQVGPPHGVDCVGADVADARVRDAVADRAPDLVHLLVLEAVDVDAGGRGGVLLAATTGRPRWTRSHVPGTHVRGGSKPATSRPRESACGADITPRTRCSVRSSGGRSRTICCSPGPGCTGGGLLFEFSIRPPCGRAGVRPAAGTAGTARGHPRPDRDQPAVLRPACAEAFVPRTEAEGGQGPERSSGGATVPQALWHPLRRLVTCYLLTAKRIRASWSPCLILPVTLMTSSFQVLPTRTALATAQPLSVVSMLGQMSATCCVLPPVAS